jgi:hypothetical protein
VAPNGCPTSPIALVWSNASANCVPCSGADASTCFECLTLSFYYNSNQGACISCKNSYGSTCTSCNETQCLSCSTGYSLSSDLQYCFSGSCNKPYCLGCDGSGLCQTCDGTHTLYNGDCICNIANCQLCVSGLCLNCFNGFAVDISQVKCNLICISNCDVCSDSISCTTCSSGFYYDSSVSQCKMNCSVIDPNCV